MKRRINLQINIPRNTQKIPAAQRKVGVSATQNTDPPLTRILDAGVGVASKIRESIVTMGDEIAVIGAAIATETEAAREIEGDETCYYTSV